MITVRIGNSLESRAQTLVNTVNCVGVMGKGIALKFRKRFPEMFDDYVKRCKRREVQPGHPYLYKQTQRPWILNFPTKDHWRSMSRLEDLVKGLEYLLAHYKEWGIKSLAVPPLGCGNGQLEWSVVGPTLYRYLSRMDIPVELYAPYGTPHNELQPEYLQATFTELEANADDVGSPKSEWIKPGWVAIVDVLNRVTEQPYTCRVGRTIFQKIAYAATYLDIPTGLNYFKKSYGPFSPDLKLMTSRLINNGLITENRRGRMFEVTVGPTYEDAAVAFADSLDQWQAEIEKVTDLFLRTNIRQAEIVATVLFAYNEIAHATSTEPTEQDVLDAVLDWKKGRTPPIGKREVASTIRNLAALKWIGVKGSPNLPLPEEEVYV